MALVLINKHLYISDIRTARNYPLLLANNIQTIVTCGNMKLAWCKHGCSTLNEQYENENNFNSESLCDQEQQFCSHTDEVQHHECPTKIVKLNHLMLNIVDSIDEDLICVLDKTVNFIAEHIMTDQNVLVHCWAGQSRSVSVCLAYIMRLMQGSVKFNLDRLKQIYPKACPNRNFLGQLYLYERMKYTVGGYTAPELRSKFFTQLGIAHHPNCPAVLNEITRKSKKQLNSEAKNCANQRPYYNLPCRLCQSGPFKSPAFLRSENTFSKNNLSLCFVGSNDEHKSEQ